MAPLPRSHGSPLRQRGGGGSSGSGSGSGSRSGGGGGGSGEACTLSSLAKWGWVAGFLGLLGLTLSFWADSVPWVGTGPDGERLSLSSAIGKTLRTTLKGGKGSSNAGGIRIRRGTPDRPLRIVGTHHKTGTMLLSMLLREGYRVHMERTGRPSGLMMGYFGNAETPGAPFSFYYCDHLYSDSWNKTEPGDHMPKLVDRHQFFGDAYDFVHLVRDPLELVISAYLYHHSAPPDWQEPWLYDAHPLSNYAFILEGSSCKPGDKTDMSWFDLLRCLNEEEGVLAEATFQTHFGALPSMTAAAKGLHDKAGTRTLQLGLEDFQEGDFDDSVRRMYTFFGFPAAEVEEIVRGCSQYDLKRQSKEEKAWNQHVTTGKFDKGRLRAFLAEQYKDPKFLEARALLGYPKGKKEEKL